MMQFFMIIGVLLSFVGPVCASEKPENTRQIDILVQFPITTANCIKSCDAINYQKYEKLGITGANNSTLSFPIQSIKDVIVDNKIEIFGFYRQHLFVVPTDLGTDDFMENLLFSDVVAKQPIDNIVDKSRLKKEYGSLIKWVRDLTTGLNAIPVYLLQDKQNSVVSDDQKVVLHEATIKVNNESVKIVMLALQEELRQIDFVKLLRNEQPAVVETGNQEPEKKSESYFSFFKGPLLLVIGLAALFVIYKKFYT